VITAEPFKSADASHWDAYVDAHAEAHFGQRSAWRQLAEEFFPVRARWWLARDPAGRIVGILPVFRSKGTLFSAPGGMWADTPEAAATLLARARAEIEQDGLRWLELRDQPVEWPGLVTNLEHVTLVLDLEASEEAQWAAFDAKLRNQIRKAEKSGLRCERGAAHLGAFHRVFTENMRDLGTPAMESAYFRRALELFGDAAEVLVAYREDVPMGGMFVVQQGTTLHDPWASSLRRYFALCPNPLVYWEAIRMAIARGARRFDFGRSQAGSGTYRFKTQFGATPRPLYYQYALGRAGRIPTLADQKASFDLAVRLWQHLPLPLARAIGPRVRRLFPEAL
jgi:FemAB-related protein (PEP-CTERM system-associated)